MVRTHSAKFGEGLRYSRSSRACSTFANTHEIRGVVARYGNKKRRWRGGNGKGGVEGGVESVYSLNYHSRFLGFVDLSIDWRVISVCRVAR